ncbi:DUF1513 domain-containing protein, partial [Bordetella bronchiseptica]
MEIDRRAFLALALAGGAAPRALWATTQADPLYLAARRRGERYEAVVLGPDGRD